VERFETLGPLDVSRTVLDNWRGWDHARTIYFIHDGPIVVVDVAKDERGSGQSAITWHLVGQGKRDGDGLWLRQDASPARLALPHDAWEMTQVTPGTGAGEMGWMPDWDMIYHSPKPGWLNLSTTFLLGDWADAPYQATGLWDEAGEVLLGHFVSITGAPGEIKLLHNESGLSLERDGLSTDGQSLLKLDLWGDDSEGICYIGGQDIRIQLPRPPAEVTDLAGRALTRGDAWDWLDTNLLLYGDSEDAQCVRVKFD
jgi:hypothetical protein